MQETFEQTDLNNVSSSDYIDDAGEHNVLISEVKFHIFQTGSTGYQLRMEDEQGRRIVDRVVYQANTMWKSKNIAVAAGLSDTEMATFTPEKLQGRFLTITTETDDKNYQRIVKYSPGTPFEPKVADLPF